MRLLNITLIPCGSASDVYSKFKKRMIFHTILETAKLFIIFSIAILFLLEYISPFTRGSLRLDLPVRIKEFISFTKSARDSSVQDVLRLTNMIRLITDDQLSEGKVLRYTDSFPSFAYSGMPRFFSGKVVSKANILFGVCRTVQVALAIPGQWS